MFNWFLNTLLDEHSPLLKGIFLEWNYVLGKTKSQFQFTIPNIWNRHNCSIIIQLQQNLSADLKIKNY